MSLLNIFLTQGGILLLEFWKIKIYSKGIYAAISAVLRVVALIIGTSIFLTYTTTPIQLTDGIEQLFAPLKKIKIPVHEFAMMMTIALRFVPTLLEETDKIMSAQKARGADMESGGFTQTPQAHAALVGVPLPSGDRENAEGIRFGKKGLCSRRAQHHFSLQNRRQDQ